jgi:hypothetical protein
MAAAYRGILIGSLICLVAGVLFFITAVSGLLFAKPTSPADLGLYSVTVVLVAFGLGGLLLRKAKQREDAATAF